MEREALVKPRGRFRPRRGDEDWVFLARADGGDKPIEDAQRVLEHLRRCGGGHVVAHSYGANAALLAAQSEPSLVRTVTLLEPACLILPEGSPLWRSTSSP